MKYTVFPLDIKKHRSSIVDLWNDYHGKNFSGRYDWLYKKNPAGITRTVVALNNDTREIVGCCSLTPIMVNINGEKLKAGIATDFIVRKEDRIYGPALKLQKMNMSKKNSDEFDLIIAFPNKSAKGPINRAGCKSIGRGIYFVKVLKSEKKINKYFDFPIITKFAAMMVDQALHILDLVRVFPIGAKNFVVKDIDDFDESFDIFRNIIKKDTIVVNRDALFLNWRYIKEKNPVHQVFCLKHKKDNSILGYVVFFVKDQIVIIEDICSIGKDNNWDNLIYQFSKSMRGKGFYSICLTYFGNPSIIKSLRRFGFIKRDLDRTVHLLVNREFSHEFKTRLLNPENWCFFDGDLDL